MIDESKEDNLEEKLKVNHLLTTLCLSPINSYFLNEQEVKLFKSAIGKLVDADFIGYISATRYCFLTSKGREVIENSSNSFWDSYLNLPPRLSFKDIKTFKDLKNIYANP